MKKPRNPPRTVGELKALIGDLPDDLKIGKRGGMGASFTGLSEVFKVNLTTFGHRRRYRLTLKTNDEHMKKYAGWRSKAFDALIFD